ncbi:MAG: hypothetical protein WBM24_15545 [Candidatus Sulfotelmatobacter sp.]
MLTNGSSSDATVYGTDHFNCGHAATDSVFAEVFVLRVVLLNYL